MFKVLIIEDDQMFSKALGQVFKKNSYDVQVAENAREGVIKAAKFKPDFIITDIMMPEMDGLTGVSHLKNLEETKDVPIAMLTVISEEQSKTNFSNLDDKINFYWKKEEVSPKIIFEKVDDFLTQQTTG